jgi:PAS domain S-box-containing protein
MNKRDIEEALRRSETQLRETLDAMGDAIHVIDKDRRIVLINKAFMRWMKELGLDERHVGKLFRDVFPFLPAKVDKEYQKVFQTGKILVTEEKTRIGERELFTETRKIPILDGDKIVQVATVVRNITEHKKAEKIQEALYRISEAVHSAESLGALYRIIHETISELMPAKNFYIALHDRVKKMLHFPYFVDEEEENPVSEPLGKGLTEYVLRTGEPLLALPKVFNGLEKKGEVVSIGPPSIDWLGVPLKTRKRTIGVMVVQTYTEGVRYTEEDKNILTFISEQVAMAIDRTRARERLNVESAYLNRLFEGVKEAIVLTDKECRPIRINSEFTRLFGFTMEDFGNLPLDDFIAPGKLHEEAHEVTEMAARGESVDMETVRKRKDGKLVNVSILGAPIVIDGKVEAVYGIYRDITDRKRAEEKIKDSLKEKEVMLYEIHHRVKNNMQIILSLLRLQSRGIEDDQTREMFIESQNRIRSMALIHEKLYQSGDLSRIDIADYVRGLGTHLVSVYSAEGLAVGLIVDIEDVYLEINRAIPVGLIVNELVTNAMKHGFEKGAKDKKDKKSAKGVKGNICITMRKEEKGKFELSVADTGKGLPVEFDINKTESFGMQLVTDLVTQLEGRIELKRNDVGSEFIITF